MHYQVTGQRIIAGGYQLFTASGFGANEHEAIADALATHPDRAAWQPHELRAEVDPINLAGLTRGTGAHVLAAISLRGHRARAGATPAASSNVPTVERMSQGGVCQSSSRHHLHHAATKTATRGAIVVGIALAIESATKAADGGQPISPRTMGLDQTTGPAWVVIGADDPSPRRITGSARGDTFSAGAGVVSVSAAGLKPPATSTGPAEFTVHPSTGFSGPAAVPSRVGGVGNRNATANDTPSPQAIAGGGGILGVQTGELKPMTGVVSGFSKAGAGLWDLSANHGEFTDSPYITSPAVGGNRTDHHAQRELREETGHQVPVLTRTRLTVNRQPEQSALSDQPGGMPGTFSTHRVAWLAKAFAVSSVILTGISAISAVMLAGRLEEE